LDVWRQLGSGAEAFQGATSPFGKQHSTVSALTIFHPIAEAQTMKQQFEASNGLSY